MFNWENDDSVKMLLSLRSWGVIWSGMLLTLVVSLAAWAGDSFGIDVGSLGSIIQEPNSYNLLQVTLHGTALNVHRTGPIKGAKCGLIFGSYNFVLEDDTASLPVFVPGPCYASSWPFMPQDGDKVVIRGYIQILLTEPRTVQAIGLSVEPDS